MTGIVSTRVATLLIVVIVAIVGGVVTILHPETLSFESYIRDVALGGGLLGVGYGLDKSSTP